MNLESIDLESWIMIGTMVFLVVLIAFLAWINSRK